MATNPTAGILDETETAQLYKKTLALNEALLLGSVRQHELTEAAEWANAQLTREISERQRTEERLRVSIKEISDFKSALDQHAIVSIADPQGIITYANDKFCAVSKYSRAELLGQDHRIVKSGHHSKEFIRDLWETITHGRVWQGEFKNKAKDGSFYWVDETIVPFLDEQGQPRQYMSIRTDITERKRATQELSEKARLLDLSNDAIIVRDFEGRIIYWNHGAEELYGWSREEAVGQVIHALLQTEFPNPIEQITEALRRNDRWVGEFVHSKRDGQRITVFVRKALDRDAEGNPAAVLETLTDITERKRTEKALREAQTRLAIHAEELEGLVAQRTAELTATNQQLEAFVYSIAHDLRAPLRSMQGFSTMLVAEAGAALSATGQDYAARINKSAGFMDALLMDLLHFSRISQQLVELTAVNLETVVASVLSRLQNDIQETQARVDSAGPWPFVLAHEPTLTQVLFNLVSNALKFVTPDVPPVVRLRAEERGGFIRVWVEDNGPGIEPDYQEQIFRLFTRLEGEKHAGTGIGLAIVQKGIERMSGRVGVESAAGQGSRFWFELRRSD